LYTERQRHRERPPDDAMPCAYRPKARRIGLDCRKLPGWASGSVAFALPSPGGRAALFPNRMGELVAISNFAECATATAAVPAATLATAGWLPPSHQCRPGTR
jgi:hypothetical protein